LLAWPNFILQYDPNLIPELAAEYMRRYAIDDRDMEMAGKRIAQGERTRANLRIICGWKSKRRLALLANNSDAAIDAALNLALKSNSIRDAVLALTSLHGVGLKMASAILTAIDPDNYTVLDFRALQALGMPDNSTIDLYVAYVEACRRLAKGCGCSLRNFDRANWQWSKRKST
jgi:hypothetical protein